MSELTYALCDEICAGVELGDYPEVVAGSLGVAKSYFSRSWTLGMEVLQRPDYPDGCSEYEQVCAYLAYQLDLSGNVAERMLLAKVRKDAEAGRSTWTAWMTILERTRPGWQRKDKLEAPGRSVEDELAEIEARKAARDAAA